MEKDTITGLVIRAANGDAAAFAQLHEDHIKSILARTTQILGNRQDGEDAAQEVMLKVYWNIAKLRDPALFRVWLHRVIVNECNMLIRKRKQHRELLTGEIAGYSPKEDRTDFLPAEFLEESEKKEALMNAIDALPAKRRNVFWLFYFEEMSYAEIARATKTSVHTVSNHLEQAKNQIRQRLSRKRAFAAMGASIPASMVKEAMRVRLDELVPDRQAEELLRRVNRRLAEPPRPAAAPKTGLYAAQRALAGILALAGALCAAGLGFVSTYTAKAVEPAGSAVSFSASAPEEKAGLPQLAALFLPPAEAGEPQQPGPGVAAPAPAQSGPAAGVVLPKDKNGNVLPGGYTAGLAVSLLDETGGVLAETRTGEAGGFSFPPELVNGHTGVFAKLTLDGNSMLSPTMDNPGGIVPLDGARPAPLYVTAGRAPAVSVSFLDGDCACGHVNPRGIALTSPDAIAPVYGWRIVRAADGTAAAAGEDPAAFGAAAARLKEEGGGKYRLEASVTDLFGNTTTRVRGFLVVPGPVAPHEFD